MKTPAVALFVFNRPRCVARVLDALRSVAPPRLFVIADGPRAAHATDPAACAETRRLVEAGVTWTCDVRWNVAAENLGCARRVSSGLDWVFSQVEKAIVLEDDCVPGERFIPFCAELLERYRDDTRVGVIAGSNFQTRDVTDGHGYYFSRYPHCWGWATWRRAWAAYDHTMADWPEVRETAWLREQFESVREARYWGGIFDRVHAGEIDSWAYRWTYACWRRGFLTALPAVNLVTNIGFGTDATHTSDRRAVAASRAGAQPWPLRHPAQLHRNAGADAHTFGQHFAPTVWTRLTRKMRRWHLLA